MAVRICTKASRTLWTEQGLPTRRAYHYFGVSIIYAHSVEFFAWIEWRLLLQYAIATKTQPVQKYTTPKHQHTDTEKTNSYSIHILTPPGATTMLRMAYTPHRLQNTAA